MLEEKVYYVPAKGDPYHHFLYACGPYESGMYACCYVYPLDDGKFLQRGIMRMLPESIFADKVEVDRHESGRVIAAANKDYPAH